MSLEHIPLMSDLKQLDEVKLTAILDRISIKQTELTEEAGTGNPSKFAIAEEFLISQRKELVLVQEQLTGYANALRGQPENAVTAEVSRLVDRLAMIENYAYRLQRQCYSMFESARIMMRTRSASAA